MVGQIADLVAEVAALRTDNASLRADLETALTMFERSSAALSSGAAHGGRRRKAGTTRRTGRAARSRAVAQSKRGRRGRATPASVTPNVVLAVIGKLGEATAAEIAAEISRAGVPVGGRAVRHLAESAGARVVAGSDGRRRYTTP